MRKGSALCVCLFPSSHCVSRMTSAVTEHQDVAHILFRLHQSGAAWTRTHCNGLLRWTVCAVNRCSGVKTFALVVPCLFFAADADVCSGARCVRACSALVLVTNTGLTCRLRDKFAALIFIKSWKELIVLPSGVAFPRPLLFLPLPLFPLPVAAAGSASCPRDDFSCPSHERTWTSLHAPILRLSSQTSCSPFGAAGHGVSLSAWSVVSSLRKFRKFSRLWCETLSAAHDPLDLESSFPGQPKGFLPQLVLVPHVQ